MKQIYLGKVQPQKELIKEVVNINKTKPLGGLWTSSQTPDGESDWIHFCLREGMRQDRDNQKFILTPREDVRMYWIDCEEELENLPKVGGENSPIDFEKLSMYYDGIQLTKNGSRELYSHPCLYGWDVECTLWFRWAFKEE